jgi:hypothetical protein
MIEEKAILILTFNRPNNLKIILEKIKCIGFCKIYISIDGPRIGNGIDKEKINQTLSVVNDFNNFFSIKINKFEQNLGCGLAVSRGVSWFFSNEESGIILEDDCIPDISFFEFCWTLLDRYKYNDKIMHISGSNFQFEPSKSDDSYYFSMYPNIWGWASWKRAWDKYDFNLEEYSIIDILKSNCNNYVKYNLLKNIVFNSKKSWSFQWSFIISFNMSCCISPNINLVQNIGYDPDATNTLLVPSWFHLMRYGSLNQFINPSKILIDIEADKNLENSVHKFSYFRFIISFLPVSLKKILKKFLKN